MLRFDRARRASLRAVLRGVGLAVLVVGCGGSAKRGPAIPDGLTNDEKIAWLGEYVVTHPTDAEAFYQLGNMHLEAHAYSFAIEAYQQCLELDPSHLEARVNLGAAFEDQGDPVQAIAQYRTAVETSPKSCMARSNLGSAMYGQATTIEAYNEAVDQYRAALKTDKKCAQALYNMGVAFADAEMYGEAMNYWKSAAGADPEGPDGPVATKASENLRILERITMSGEASHSH